MIVTPFSYAYSATATEEGTLGLAFNFRGDLGFTGINDKPLENHNLFATGLSFIGISPGYGIILNITFIDDMVHVQPEYLGETSFLNLQQIQPFSFSDLELSYLVQHWEKLNLLFLLGGKIGHIGYLSPNFDATSYIIYISPVISGYWFTEKYFSLSTKIDFPIGLYRPNLAHIFHLRTSIELTFEPTGYIHDLSSAIALFAVGLSYQFVWLRTQANNINASLSLLTPYLKFTLLY